MARSVSVRIVTGTVDRHLTEREVRSLTYRTTAPGGHETANLTVRVPLNSLADLTPNDRLYIYSRRTGKVVWEGYTDQVTALKGPGGEEFTITALGAQALLRDRSEKLIYLYKTRDGFKQEDLADQVPGAQVETSGSIPTGTAAGTAAVVIQFPSGTALVTDSEAGVRDYSFRDSLMRPGALSVSFIGGAAAGNAYLYGDTTGGGGGGALAYIDDQGNSTTGNTLTWYADPTVGGAPAVDEWVYGTDSLGLSYRWTAGATTIANDTTWLAFYDTIVQAQRVTVSGTDIQMSTEPIGYVLASEIVTDLIGRMLPFVDPSLASIAATTYQLDQVTFADGITAAGVLEWLTTFEPDFFHELLESDPTTGKHRLNFREWDDGTTPRYAIRMADGFVRPGGEQDRCNCVYVYWTDEQGIQRRWAVGQDIPELGGNPVVAGEIDPTLVARVKQANSLTLPVGISSQANAAQVGAALLEQSNRGSNAGTAALRREVVDLWTGVRIRPGEMLPGYTILVSETLETHRLTGVEVDATTGVATLTLNDPVRTLEQYVADAVGKRGDTTAKASR